MQNLSPKKVIESTKKVRPRRRQRSQGNSTSTASQLNDGIEGFDHNVIKDTTKESDTNPTVGANETNRKLPSSNNSNGPDTIKDSESILRKRQARLEKWKQHKRLKEKNSSAPPETKTLRSKDSDTQVQPQASSKYRDQRHSPPPKLNKGKILRRVNFDTENLTESSKIENVNNFETTLKNNDNSCDPLDAFMQELSSLKRYEDQNKTSNDHEYVSDELPDNTSLIGDLANDYSSEQRYHKISKYKKKKRVQPLYYSNLKPFQKNFYQESESISELSEDDVRELRTSLDNMKVTGDNCPRPITKWSQLGLPKEMFNLLYHQMRFKTLTPIQSQAIPCIMSGFDVIGIAKTGSGKTISYLLPLIRQIKAQPILKKNETGPLGLVLAPTRELALQIMQEASKLLVGQEKIRVLCCTGGSELKSQIDIIKGGVEIIVATPGRLIDLITLNKGTLMNTRRIAFVVMDEADRLFDMGFEPQITDIMKTIRPDKQCVLFSATFPESLRGFVSKFLHEPYTIEVNREGLINERITQKFVICRTEDEKFAHLMELLDENSGFNFTANSSPYQEKSQRAGFNDEKSIVFASSQQSTDMVYERMMHKGFKPFLIHAGKPYYERVSNLENFKATPNATLLTTEVLSRGLNVPEVTLVIIYNAIRSFSQYVHTAGRTARGSHNGTAITLLLEDDYAAAYIIQKALRDEDKNLHSWDQLQKLSKMSTKFHDGLLSGKYKLSKGLGGKGLENLGNNRDDPGSLGDGNDLSGQLLPNNGIGAKGASSSNDNDGEIMIPKIDYELETISDKGSQGFLARVYINDLPQVVRWQATKNDTLNYVKSETGCSVTNKGKFYPEGTYPADPNAEPKLYLLIEGTDKKDIELSIQLLEEKVKEGIKKQGIRDLLSTKY